MVADVVKGHELLLLFSALLRREDPVMLKASPMLLLKTSLMTMAPRRRTTSKPFGSSMSTRERLGS